MTSSSKLVQLYLFCHKICRRLLHATATRQWLNTDLFVLKFCCKLPTWNITHSLTAARNQLWVVAPSTLTGRQQEPMRRQQWVRFLAQSDSSM